MFSRYREPVNVCDEKILAVRVAGRSVKEITENGRAMSSPVVDCANMRGGRDNGVTLRGGVVVGLVLLVLVAGLVVYKSAGALRQLEYARANGSVALRADVVSTDSPFAPVRLAAQAANYLAVIWPALVFGILISAGVRTFVPVGAVARVLAGGPIRRQVIAGASGAPLMLCSCCAAPLFSSVYERSRHLGPSLALMLAAPALNPAALALTFLLFPASIAWGRLSMSIVAVFVGTAVVAQLAPGARIGLRVLPLDRDAVPPRQTIWSFVESCLHVTVRTVPVILLGIAAAMLFADRVQAHGDVSATMRVWSIAATAAIAVPIALPTFFEIPLAVTLLAAGAPPGAAAALLFAGPAVNLASLLTVGREAGWKAVWIVAAMVWLIAVAGGLAVG